MGTVRIATFYVGLSLLTIAAVVALAVASGILPAGPIMAAP